MNFTCNSCNVVYESNESKIKCSLCSQTLFPDKQVEIKIESKTPVIEREIKVYARNK
jgi:ribosomal protein S27E